MDGDEADVVLLDADTEDSQNAELGIVLGRDPMLQNSNLHSIEFQIAIQVELPDLLVEAIRAKIILLLVRQSYLRTREVQVTLRARIELERPQKSLTDQIQTLLDTLSIAEEEILLENLSIVSQTQTQKLNDE